MYSLYTVIEKGNDLGFEKLQNCLFHSPDILNNLKKHFQSFSSLLFKQEHNENFSIHIVKLNIET